MNNTEIFNGAYEGAIGGMLAGRIQNSTTSSTYNSIVADAVAFANAVDATISGGEISNDQQLLMMNICNAFWSSRSPQSAVQADYATMAQVIKTIYNNAAANLA
jgi:hypothetical protein